MSASASSAVNERSLSRSSPESASSISVTSLRNVSSCASREKGTSLIAVSGSLPDTVYSDSEDLINDWISAGGRLYWAGNFIGKYYSTADGTHEVAGYETRFLGAECLNHTSAEKARTMNDSNDYGNALALMNTGLEYCVDTSKVVGRYLSVGYCDGTFSSTVLMERGDGMICVFGGDYSNQQRSDLAQLVSSQIDYDSTIISHISGTVTRGSVHESKDGLSGSYSVYTYLGGYYHVFGRNFEFDI